MTKYEIFDYDIDIWKGGDYTINGIVPTGLTVYIDASKASKASICEKLGLNAPYNDPDKIDVNYNDTGVIYVYNNNNWRPICELHAVK